MTKPRLKPAEVPDRIKRHGIWRHVQSVNWWLKAPDGDASVYFGDAGERLVVYTHEVRLDRSFPRLSPGFHPVVAGLIL